MYEFTADELRSAASAIRTAHEEYCMSRKCTCPDDELADKFDRTADELS